MDALGKLISNLNSNSDFQRFFFKIYNCTEAWFGDIISTFKKNMVEELTTDQKLFLEALESGEDTTQKLKSVINNLLNSEDADKRTKYIAKSSRKIRYR